MIAFIDNVLYEALPYALVALGVVLTFRYLRLIDLTFAASFVAGPAVTGALMLGGVPFLPALMAAIVVAVAFAAATFSLMWFLEIDGLLAGLLTSFAGFAIALLFTQGTLSLHTLHTPFDSIKAFDFHWLDGNIPLHPAQIMLFLVLILATKILADRFLNSELGLAFRAMEDEKSRQSLLASIGLSHWKMLCIGLIFGNGFCAASGVLVMLKEGQVTASRGFDVFLIVITAYLFGTMLFERRPLRKSASGVVSRLLTALARFRPTSAAVLGIVFYFALLSLVSRLDVPASLPKLLMVALVVAGFVATRWTDIATRFATIKENRTRLVDVDAPFEAVDVHVEYPGFPRPVSVIGNARLRLSPGSATQIYGPNGSGKSTLLKYLGGRIPGKGCVSVPAVDHERTGDRERLIGYISQDADLGSCATLSVSENLALFKIGQTRSAWRSWRTQEETTLPRPLRALVASTEGIPTEFLSGGQRQVLNVAAMIVRRDAPRVILFDEPLTHLDEDNAVTCVEFMERLLTEGRILLVVQHDVDPGAVYENSAARTRLASLIKRTIDLAALQKGEAT